MRGFQVSHLQLPRVRSWRHHRHNCIDDMVLYTLVKFLCLAELMIMTRAASTPSIWVLSRCEQPNCSGYKHGKPAFAQCRFQRATCCAIRKCVTEPQPMEQTQSESTGPSLLALPNRSNWDTIDMLSQGRLPDASFSNEALSPDAAKCDQIIITGLPSTIMHEQHASSISSIQLHS